MKIIDVSLVRNLRMQQNKFFPKKKFKTAFYGLDLEPEPEP